MRILHKALEAAQQEKRVTSAYLAAAEDKDRLELVRHKVRQIVELGQRVEALERERDSLAQTASLQEQELQELRQHVQLLMDKNEAKQQVICKLSEKLTQDSLQPPDKPLMPRDAANSDFLSQQEKMEHLKVGAPPSRPRASGEGTAVHSKGFVDMAGITLNPGMSISAIDAGGSMAAYCLDFLNQKAQCNSTFPWCPRLEREGVSSLPNEKKPKTDQNS